MVNEATTTEAPAESETPGGDVGGADDLTALRRALDEERKQRRSHERQLKELQAAQLQAEDAKKSDLERVSAELAKARAEREQLASDLRRRDVRDAFLAAAERVGARKPRDLFKVLYDDLTFDDAGVPTNVKELIDARRKSDPDDFRSTGSADGAARGMAAPTGDAMNVVLRRAAGRQ